jgi:peptidyl-prolyl cis-trans isomerase D
MVNLMRRFSKPLLTVVAVLTIISFVYFFNMQGTRNGGSGRSDKVATAYGRDFTKIQADQAERRFEVCFALRMADVLFALVGRQEMFMAFTGRRATDADVNNYIWNSLVLRHESAELGTDPTDAEIAQTIQEMPQFQANGAFSYPNYAQFMQNVLSPKGFTQHDFEEIVADQLRVAKVRKLVGATVRPAPSEVREQYVQMHQKTEASMIRLKLEDFKAAVQVSDEDVAKAFEERKEALKTPEQRKVKVAAFTHAGDAKPLTGPERAEASQRLSEQARKFSESMEKPGASFDAAAAEANVKVIETPLFPEEDPPSELNKSDAAAKAAFALTPEHPTSDVVTSDNGYFVLQLSGTEPSRPLTAEEAKPKLIEQLKQERGQEAMNLKATELRNKIEAELKAGKPFEEAAKTAGAEPEKLPPFSAEERKPDATPELDIIMQRAGEMNEGDLSEFIPNATGGILFHIDKRLPIDEDAFQKDKSKLAQQIEQMRAEELFQDWLRDRRAAAKITVARG